MRTNKLQDGFSLLDIILGIIFLSVAFIASLVTIRNLQSQENRMEAIIRGSTMANDIMEVIRAHAFDENAVAPWSDPPGPEEGVFADYDDIDDYIGYSFSYPGYFGFSGLTRVFYVDPNINLMDSVGTVTDYKRIIVTVNHPELQTPVNVTSLMSP